MRKYAFRQGDIVRENTTEKNPVVGRVIGCGSSAGHDYYKIESGEEIYNARDDELVLIRRRFDPRSNPPCTEDELERDLLIWQPMSSDPPKGAECLAVWKTPKDEDRVSVVRWNGEGWIFQDLDGDEYTFHRETFRAWSLWEWPEIDQKPDGEEGVRDDSDDDQDDGQGGD